MRGYIRLGRVVMFALCSSGASGWANTEVPLTYDARSAAMGGTGAAFQWGASAAAHNPALLSQIDSYALSATFTPYYLTLHAPFASASGMVKEHSSKPVLGPFGQAAGAYRVSERWTVGALAYLTTAVGGDYEGIPLQALDASVPKGITGNARFAMAAMELAVPVSVRLSRSLSVGVAYRATFVLQTAQITAGSRTPLAEANLSGRNLAGVQLGVLYNIAPPLDVAVVYKSKVEADLSGERVMLPGSTAQGSAALNAPRGYRAPHQVRVGLAWHLPYSTLLALDSRYWFYHDADPSMRDAYNVAVGAEYMATPYIPLRAGYSLATQATTNNAAQAFASPPGVGHGFSAGTGWHMEHLKVDVACGYVIAGGVTQTASVPGNYYAGGFMTSLSVTFIS